MKKIKLKIDGLKDNLSKDYDAIIVVHGTDTLHYSASALKIMLGEINIPVLFVSSNFIV